ncbi:TMEM175 family protein [uncultured Aquimarina sp.]|uniref:TMEM175 family protein n=1 Tax=uncultured Aquimarina sp. TaxID=575652 RepID=UPI002617764F|nr:TMEM175 family protein [uncultured Aquimarina sp.]
MKTTRLEAFSDAVMAIIITIMVLELKAPEETDFSSLIPKIPIFLSYLVSFVYIAIYWNNHHHLFQVTEKVNGKILWANMHVLFWVSLIPFSTSWLGENHEASVPAALYGIILLMIAIASIILQQAILKHHDHDFMLRDAIGNDLKGKLTILIYVIGIITSFFNTWFAVLCYIIVAIIWFIPDKRIEKNV